MRLRFQHYGLNPATLLIYHRQRSHFQADRKQKRKSSSIRKRANLRRFIELSRAAWSDRIEQHRYCGWREVVIAECRAQFPPRCASELSSIEDYLDLRINDAAIDDTFSN